MKWILLNADGTTAAQVITDEDRRPGKRENPDKLRMAKVERFGEPGERWIDGKWRMVDGEAQAAAINAAHLANHGPFAVDLGRRQKATEARLILAGVDINGLVAAEARATEQDVRELAQTIADAAAASETIEIERIVARREVRKEPA